MPVPHDVISMLEDFETNRLWGRVKLDYKDGEIVFIEETVTRIPPNRKNLSGESMRNNGTHDRKPI